MWEGVVSRVERQLTSLPGFPKVRTQRAPESLPLILEPESAFYTSPVLVLDFQSLYPSMMIAYNICYSTCLGMVRHRIWLVAQTQRKRPRTGKDNSAMTIERRRRNVSGARIPQSVPAMN